MTQCCRCGSEVKLVAGQYAMVAPENKPAHLNAEACEDVLRAEFQRKLNAVRARGQAEQIQANVKEQTIVADAEVKHQEEATKAQAAEEAKVRAAQEPKPAPTPSHTRARGDSISTKKKKK